LIVLFKKRTKNISPAGLQLVDSVLSFLTDESKWWLWLILSRFIKELLFFLKKRTKNISPAGLQLGEAVLNQNTAHVEPTTFHQGITSVNLE
jgi:hypothetical protein